MYDIFRKGEIVAAGIQAFTRTLELHYNIFISNSHNKKTHKIPKPWNSTPKSRSILFVH